MWDFIKSWKFMAIVLGILFVGAGIGVTYGVLSHHEPGFKPAPEWTHFHTEDMPLRVEVYDYSAENDAARESDPWNARRVHSAEAEEAISRFNRRVGRTVFVLAPAGEDGSIEIHLNAPVEVGHFGVELCADRGGNSNMIETPEGPVCVVTTRNILGAGDLETLVIYHELGHCLLLDHDCFRQSIMCGGTCCTLSPTPDRQVPPWISDYDAEQIRQRYF